MLRYFCNSAVSYICVFDSIFVRTQSSSCPMEKNGRGPFDLLKKSFWSVFPVFLTFLSNLYTFSAGASFWQLVLEKDVGPFDLVGKSGHVWLSEPYTGCGPPLCARHNVHLEPYMDLMHCITFCKQVERDIQLEWLMLATGEHTFSSWIIISVPFFFFLYFGFTKRLPFEMRQIVCFLWDCARQLHQAQRTVFVVFQFRAHICV